MSTLTQDTGVTGVELSVDGVPVNIAGLDGPAGDPGRGRLHDPR